MSERREKCPPSYPIFPVLESGMGKPPVSEGFCNIHILHTGTRTADGAYTNK